MNRIRPMPYTIFVTAPRLATAGRLLLDEAGCKVLTLTPGAGAAEVEALMASHPVDAVISRTVPLSARAIASCPTLKVISKHGVGVSNIDVAAATARGIPVYVTPGANAQSVAELTIALMLGAARKIALLDRETRAGHWLRAQDGLQLGGRTLGLVGFGQVGRRVAQVALALGMTVRAYDPALDENALPTGVRRTATLDELLADTDVLSLHVPLTLRTRGLLGAREFARLRRGAIVVNTARGEVIDEAALLQALQEGQLFAAGLDTMAQEPLPANSALAAHPQVILTPHVGASTAAALDAMAAGAARIVLGWLRGDPADPTACVNPQTMAAATAS